LERRWEVGEGKGGRLRVGDRLEGRKEGLRT